MTWLSTSGFYGNPFQATVWSLDSLSRNVCVTMASQNWTVHSVRHILMATTVTDVWTTISATTRPVKHSVSMDTPQKLVCSF